VEESLRSSGVTVLLYQDVEHFAILVDCALEGNKCPIDLGEHIIEVPFIAAAIPPTTKPPSVGGAKPQAPEPYRLVEYFDAPLKHHLLHVSKG